MSIDSLTLLVVLVTIVLFALAGVLYSRRRVATIEDYVTARDTMGPGLATATLVASGMGAWILFSPAETGVVFGLVAIIGYAVGVAAPLLAFFFLGPRMRALMPRGHSLTEYVWHRYGRITYLFILGVILFYMFVFLAAELTGIALAVRQVVEDMPLWATALAVGVATMAYTTYGGLKASVFTDGLQFIFIVPLLLVGLIATAVALGGAGTIVDGIKERAPQLLQFDHRPGIEFAVALIIAILAANLFHQGYWQRIYSCRNDATVRRAFLYSMALVIPIVFAGGLFGLMAIGDGEVENASIALFTIILDNLSTGLIMLVLVLALALVMSSMDTLLNGMVSLFASDLARIKPGVRSSSLLNSSRVLTVALIIPAIVIASQGYDVLYMFLIADLVAAGAIFPMFFGLYARHFGGTMAVISIVLGIAVGLLFFPTSDFTGVVIPLLEQGNTMWSFVAALLVSAGVAVTLTAVHARMRPGKGYDFTRLQQQVHLIQG